MVAVCFVFLALGVTSIALAQTPCATSPANRRFCAPEASCTQKGCACPLGTIGDPHLLCVHDNQAFCELFGDPHLKTFSGELSPVPIPCMYRATRFYARDRTDSKKPYVKVEVLAANSLEPVGGQYYVAAAKVIISMVTGDDPSNPTSQTAETVYYISSDAITNATGNYTTSPWTVIGTYQHFVDTTYQSVNNRAILTIPLRDVTVTFIPFDTTQSSQTRLSGLALATAAAPETLWLDADFPITFCSSKWGGNILRKETEWNQTAEHVTVYGVLMQQLQDPISGTNNGGCEAAVTQFGICGTLAKRISAVQTCAPLVAKSSLASCLPSPAMAVLANCLKFQCNRDNSTCLKLKIAAAKCPEFKTFVPLNC